MSNEVVKLMAEASQAERAGDFQNANRLYGEVLALDPRHREALLYYGLTFTRLGRNSEAISQLEQLVALDPKSLVALNWLSLLLRDAGQIQPALDYSERAVQVNPNDVEAIYNLGLCYLGLSRFEEAIFCFERTTSLSARFGPGYYAAACAYEAIGQPWSALLAMRKNIEIDPFAPGFLKLSQLYLAVGSNELAIEFALKALPGVRGPEAHAVLAEAYADSSPELAKAHHESAVKLAPGLEIVLENSRAKRLSRLGRLSEALAINARLRDREPKSGTAYLNWVTIKKVTPDDLEIVRQMEAMLDTPSPAWEDKCSLHYALGKSYDDLGEYERAMAHFDVANGLKFANTPSLASFHPSAFRSRIDQSIKLFTRGFLETNLNRKNTTERPIFIVGMMRTGTTLMEQILCRHLQVAAGGELAHWSYSASKIIDFQRRQINRDRLLESSERYLELLNLISPEAYRVTDKNPANILMVGLIRLAFPKAHIIQMERSPLDTAISIYTTPVRTPPEFGCKRDHIVTAIQETQRLALHWREVIPAENYHLVHYEELVSEPQAVIQRTLVQCGLSAEGFDLNAAGTGSIIGTPSLWQARQPVTNSSVGRAERYASWLGEFKKLDYCFRPPGAI